ncbi:MAG: hypothetical protein ABJD07_06290 [Gemmatimonadaceae bacterium]
MFAATAPGLEALAERELHSLGIAGARAETGGVAFTGTHAELQRANLWLRTASRVLVRVAEFEATAFHELERLSKRVRWERYISAALPVRLRVTCKKSRLYHSDAVAERVAGAIAGRVTGATTGPTVGASADDDDETESESQLIVVRLSHDRCTISVDASGALLHRRGYRLQTAKAPLRETLAAAALLASGWDGVAPLVDPLCGSGTIAIEAALIARRIAPGARRRFAFMRWPGFDAAAWTRLLETATAGELPGAPAPIVASDRDAGAVEAAAANAARAGVAADVMISMRALSALVAPPGRGWLVTNPPYGLRVGERAGLRDLYAQLGNVARRALPGWTVAMVSADRSLERATKLAFAERLKTQNGGIPVRIIAAPVDG